MPTRRRATAQSSPRARKGGDTGGKSEAVSGQAAGQGMATERAVTVTSVATAVSLAVNGCEMKPEFPTTVPVTADWWS